MAFNKADSVSNIMVFFFPFFFFRENLLLCADLTPFRDVLAAFVALDANYSDVAIMSFPHSSVLSFSLPHIQYEILMPSLQNRKNMLLECFLLVKDNVVSFFLYLSLNISLFQLYNVYPISVRSTTCA